MLDFWETEVRFETYRGRYGIGFDILYGSWGLNICLDFCWWSLAIEIPKKEEKATMTGQVEFPFTFKKCPMRGCGCEETVTRIGAAAAIEKGHIPAGSWVSAEKVLVPLMTTQPPILTTQVDALLYHYDVCARCGHRYCTRVETIQVPVSGLGMKQPPPGFGHGSKRGW